MSTKQQTLYAIREYAPGRIYSKSIFRKIVSRTRALRIVKRLKKAGRDVIASPMRVTVKA